MLFGSRTRCANGWGSSTSRWNRPRPSWSNLVDSRSDTRAIAAGNARRPSTSWASRSTARETRKATSGLGCAPRSHACGAVSRLRELMRQMRHHTIPDQVGNLNSVMRGHYAYYGIAGNFRALQKVYRAVERYWHKMLCSRSWTGRITWDVFHQIKARTPILRPKLFLPYRSYSLSLCCEPTSEERSAGNPHATFCGSRGWATASGDPVGTRKRVPTATSTIE